MRGLVEIGHHILLMLLLAILVVAFIWLVVQGITERMEEQQVLDSVRNLVMAMDYVCRTGQPTEVEVRLPQRVTQDNNPWIEIAGLGDPKYIIYFERFPGGEEWAWTTLSPAGETWWQAAVSAAIVDIGIDLATAGISKVFKPLSGAVKNLWSKVANKIDDFLLRWKFWQRISGANADVVVRFSGGKIVGIVEALEKGGDEAAEALTKAAAANEALSALGGAKAAVKIGKKVISQYVDEITETTTKVMKNLDEVSEAGSKLVRIGAEDEADKVRKLVVETLGQPGARGWEMNVLNPNKHDDIIETATEVRAILAEAFGEADESVKAVDELIDNVNKLKSRASSDDNFAKVMNAMYAYASKVEWRVRPTNFVLNEIWGKGKWQAGVFVFNTFLSPFDKANEKFAFCGVNSLCIKTPWYIGVYKLSSCERSDIVFVKIDKKFGAGYEPSWWGEDLWKRIEHGWINLFSRERRFYLASPCGYKFRIELAECECYEEPVKVYDVMKSVEDGVSVFKERIVGLSYRCEGESPISDDYSKIKVKCLKVIPENPLPGYAGGSGERQYHNFCFSAPQEAKIAADWLVTGLMIGAQVGIAVATAGTSLPAQVAIFTVSDVATNFGAHWGYAQIAARMLWPNGIAA